MCLFAGKRRISTFGSLLFQGFSLPSPFIRNWKGDLGVRATSSLVWSGLAPPTVEVCCWLAVLGKVSVVGNLRGTSLEAILNKSRSFSLGLYLIKIKNS